MMIQIITTEAVLAGGGGCGDFCDQTKTVMTCGAESFVITSPDKLTEKFDILNAETLQRNLKPAFKVSFNSISLSYNHPFDPDVLYSAWVAGLYDSIFTDQLKWPNYDYTKGYKVDPVSGAFQFAGVASPGWSKAKAEFSKNSKNEPTLFILRSIETGVVLLEAALNCSQK